MPRALIRLSLVIILAVYTLLVVAGLISASPLRAAKLPADLTVDPGESIQAAIDAANSGDTIIINAGLYTESLTLSKPVSLTGVNSATTIIRAMAGQRVLTVTGATISNSVVISGLTFTGGDADYGGGLYSDAPLGIINSRFISNTAGEGGGLYAGEWFTPTALTVTGTDFIDNAATRGGGLYLNGAASLLDVRFENNTAVDLGGAINARNGNLDLTRAIFLQNTGSAVYSYNSPAIILDSRFEANTGDIGGAVWMYQVGAAISGTGFFSNTATLGGGAVTMIDGTIVNSRFQGNTVQENWGGGLYAMGTTLVTRTDFISNAAQSNGGGAYFGNVELHDSRFEGNTSVTGGGGGFFAFGTLISHTDLIGNQASCTTWGAGCGGGGAYAFNAATVVNSRFENNVAPGNGNGGGMYANGALSIADSTFISNAATGAGGLFAGQPVTLTNVDFIRNAGGGAVLGGPSIVTGGHFVGNQGGGLGTDRDAIISGTAFISNSAGIGGGLYANYTATLYNARFEGNIATTYGGGLFAEHTDVISNSAFINNTAANGGGAAIGEVRWLSDTIFIGNVASQYGGGLFGGGPASIVNALFARNSAFISNTAHAAGGGLYASGPVTLIGASFINNHTFNGLGGGGLFAEGSITISDTEFIGNSSYGGGGLMQWSDVAPVHIFRSHFERNTGAYGGGLASFGSDCTLIDTNFVSNTSRAGGGAFIGSANLLLRGGRFEGNNCSESSASCHAGSTGGGLFISSTVTITGTTFINNSTAYQGGAIDFYGGGGRLINTLFARNSAAIGAAISFESPGNTAVLHSSFANPTATGEPAIAVFQGALFLTNTIIASHTIGISNTGGVVYEDYNLFFNTVTNTISVTSGGHSFNGDPRFVDPARDDYHLLLGSAAIDHGVDAGVYTDLDGNVRPYGAGFDIGAYEYAGPPHHVFLPLVH